MNVIEPQVLFHCFVVLNGSSLLLVFKPREFLCHFMSSVDLSSQESVMTTLLACHMAPQCLTERMCWRWIGTFFFSSLAVSFCVWDLDRSLPPESLSLITHSKVRCNSCQILMKHWLMFLVGGAHWLLYPSVGFLNIVKGIKGRKPSPAVQQ